VVLPTRCFAWARGRPAGGGEVGSKGALGPPERSGSRPGRVGTLRRGVRTTSTSVGRGSGPRPHGPADLAGLGAYLRAPDLSTGDLHRSGAIRRHLLSGGELGIAGADHGARQRRSDPSAEPVDQRSVGTATTWPVSRATTEQVSEYEARELVGPSPRKAERPLEWTDLDWDKAVLEVSKSREETKQGLRIQSTKNDQPAPLSLVP
jgi:hypothetical protein